ncbi:MAG: hypothetical protein ACRDGQ_11250 [Candidatus Limnocylindrales bacterium]
MALVRTNITIPQETLELVDAVAGPRGRSAYIAEVVARQVRRDNARRVFRKYAGACRGSTGWGRTDAEVDANLRRLREEWDRPWIWEDDRALPARLDGPDRPRPRPAKRPRATRVAAQRAE